MGSSHRRVVAWLGHARLGLEFFTPGWAQSSPCPAGLGALHARLGSELSMPGWQWCVDRMSVRLTMRGVIMITNSVTVEIDR